MTKKVDCKCVNYIARHLKCAEILFTIYKYLLNSRELAEVESELEHVRRGTSGRLFDGH